MFDIVIVGAGCAGMTAAIYAARAGKKVLLLEGESIGGQISFSPLVENYPAIPQISGAEFSDRLFSQAEALGVEFSYEAVLSVKDGAVKTVVTDSGEYECRAVILATGVKHRHLGVEREEELTGSGVSYCAVCDGAFFKGKRVAVAGGGNTALQDAVFLSEICESVTIIHRREEFRGENRLVELLKTKPNVSFELNKTVKCLLGDNALSGVVIADKLTGEEKTLEAEGLFVAVGQVPGNSAFETLVSLDEGGYVAADEGCKTSAEGIFTAGDCRTKSVRQLTTAAADGAVAAVAACDFLSRGAD